MHCICLRRPYLSLQLTTRALPSDGHVAPRPAATWWYRSISKVTLLFTGCACEVAATNQDTRRVYRLCIGADFGFWPFASFRVRAIIRLLQGKSGHQLAGRTAWLRRE